MSSGSREEYGGIRGGFYINPDLRDTEVGAPDNIVRILSLVQSETLGIVALAERAELSDSRFVVVESEETLGYTSPRSRVDVQANALQLVRDIVELPISAGYKILDIGSKIASIALPGTANGR
jgi:hypothetical protein